MAISYVGGQVAGRANPSSAVSVDFGLSGGSDALPAAGDLVIITCVTGSAAGNPAMAITTPTGYTALGQLNQSAVTADTSMDVSYKRMGGTPDTAFTVPGTTNSAWGEAYSVQVFRGVDATTPMDAAAVSAGGTATGRPDPGSITPVTTGAWVVICGGGAAGTGVVYTAPANFTDDFLTFVGADTTDAMVGSGYWTGWTSGAVNPAAYTGGTTGANDSWSSYTLALRPAVTLSQIAGTAAMSFGAGSSSLKGAGALAGAAAVAFAGVPALVGAGALSGVGAIAFAGTPALVGAGALSGAAAQTFGGTATVAGAGALAGAAAVAFTHAAVLDGVASGDVAGAIGLTFSNTATLTAQGALAGTAAISFGGTPALAGSGAVAGAAGITFGHAATMGGAGAIPMSGIASLGFTPQGVLLADGALAGASVLSLLAAAALDGALYAGTPRLVEIGGGPGIARMVDVSGVGAGVPRDTDYLSQAGVARSTEIAAQTPSSTAQRPA